MNLHDLLRQLFGGGQEPGGLLAGQGGFTPGLPFPEAPQGGAMPAQPPAPEATSLSRAPVFPDMPMAGGGGEPVHPADAMLGISTPPARPRTSLMDAATGSASRGGGGMLEELFMPKRAARNKTIGWLQEQGLDAGTAEFIGGNKQMLQTYLMQRMKGADPMAALQQEKLGLEIEGLRNPTTNDIKEYEYAKRQGYQGTLPQFMTEMKKAGATSIDNRQMGTVPPGYRAEYDEQGNVTGLAPIPGGPAQIEADEEARKRRAGSEVTLRAAQTVFEDTERALEVLDRSGNWAAGAGSYLAALPGTDARALKKHVDSIKGNVGIDSLLKIKESGAGLGNIPQTQLEMLASLLGNLDTAQTPEDLRFNLARIQEIYSDIVQKEGGDPVKMYEDRLKRIGGGLGAPSPGTVEEGDDGIRYRFKGGDPGEPANWEKVQ